MAGDWLKIEANTPEKEEVLAITSLMGWDDCDLTIGKLFRLWRWFDQHTTNGNAARVTPALLDRIVGVAGFCEAVSAVGWLVIDDQGITLPRFDRHNGKTAKSRALTAKRVASHKASGNADGNASGNDGSVIGALPREEKRREEEAPHSPPEGGTPSGGSSKRSEQIGLTAFLAACHELGESAIPEDDAVFAYADSIGLPHEFVSLAWAWFKRKWANKRQAGVRGWRQTFRNAVQDNWPKYWFVDGDGVWQLTTAGKQAQMAAEAGEGA